jgi:hypothetical protein
MSRRPAAIPAFLLCCALCCIAPGLLTDAVAAPANPNKDLDQQRTRFREAHDLAERGDERWKVRAEGLSDEYPLYPYLEQAAFLHDLPHAEREALVAFLERHGDAPFARTLRRQYLKLLARDARWPEFLALYAHEDDLGLRCAEVAALSAQNASDPVLPERARAILSAGKTLPWSAPASRRTHARPAC